MLRLTEGPAGLQWEEFCGGRGRWGKECFRDLVLIKKKLVLIKKKKEKKMR